MSKSATARQKTTKQTTTPKLIPQPNGRGALRAGGTPGNKGGGRHKDELKALMRELASNPKTITQLRAILQDKDHPQFVKAWIEAREVGYGKEATPVEQSGSMTLNVVLRSE